MSSPAGWFARVSLRVKLTLWVIGIFAVIQVTFAAVFLLYERDSAYTGFRTDLNEGLQSLIWEVSVDEPGALDVKRLELLALGLRGSWVNETRVAFINGGEVLVTGEVDPNAMQSLMEADLGAEPHAWVIGQTGIAAQRIETTSGNGLLAVFSPDVRVRRRLQTILGTIMMLLAGGVAATGLAGWFVAGAAVAPLGELRRMASGLNPESLGSGGSSELSGSSEEVSTLRDELDLAMERLERGYASQGRFISNVSHELKTPIGVIIAEAQTLPDLDDAPKSVRDFVRSTVEEMQRLGRMVESFLVLTRVTDARVHAVHRVTPVNDLVLDSVIHCRTMARQYAVELHPLLEDSGEAMVMGDEDLLRTSVDNLVRNAIRFSPRGAPVHLRVEADADSVRIRVSDRGPGIPDDLIERVFDRFAQAPGEERRGRGHGLGLEIAKGIVELHKGEISVRNLPEGGCEFLIRLPRAV